MNIKKRLLLIAMLIVGLNASAYDFEAGGIYYNILSETDLTCEVTKGIDKYSGSITIPETAVNQEKTYKVTTIESMSFHKCDGLTSVNIPNSVTHIGFYAFLGCSSLTSVTVPNSVTYIGGSAFSDCDGLTEIKVNSDNKDYCDINGVLFNKNKDTIIQYPGGRKGAYSIPNSVTFIEGYAFEKCIGLTSVTIPDSVTEIGELAFSDCSSLTEIKVNGNNNDYRDINGVLFYNDFLLQYPGGRKGAYSVPDNVIGILDLAFLGCSGLTSVTIPNSVTYIGEYTFSNCDGLTSIALPNSVTAIASSTFENCSGLTSVTIPNSVTQIGDLAFSGCSSLTSVTIPNSVTIIGMLAFSGCSSLTEINSLNSVPPTLIMNEQFKAFEDTHYQNVTLNVPKGSLDAYKQALGWKNFLKIQEKDFSGVESVEGDEVKVFANGNMITVVGAEETAVVEVFNLNGQLVCRGFGNEFEVGNSGIYIVRIAGKTYKVAVM